MNKVIRTIFDHMPSYGKDLIVSLYGSFRNSWRYNRDSAALIEEAGLREEWSLSQWKIYQENCLDKLLHRAYHHIPYYRNHWSKRRQKGDQSSYTNLENWPVIDKQVVRSSTLAFLAESCNPKKMYHEHTGGTSGSPLNVYWSKETTLRYYAIFERRIRNWHGVSKDTRYGILGGQMLIPFSRNKPPFWVRNLSMNQLYMSSYHIRKDSVAAYINAMNSFEIDYLFGYASSLYSIALLGLSQNLTFPSLRVVISNAEPLFDYQAELITKAFGCPVVNTYGMSELVAAACTSPTSNGFMELWPEVGFIENVTSIETERIVSTGILNQDMGLIRYDVGDNGKFAYPSTGKIDYYKIQQLEGRNDDLVTTRDGRRIGRLDTVFKRDLGILEAQIVQEDIGTFTIYVVPDETYEKSTSRILIESLKERVGKADVTVVPIEKIPRTRMGKFRAVISKVQSHQE